MRFNTVINNTVAENRFQPLQPFQNVDYCTETFCSFVSNSLVIITQLKQKKLDEEFAADKSADVE